MKKIVELRINTEEFESETLGVDVLSLVEAPAIGYEWMAFNEQNFIQPKSGESEDDFVGRCIPVLIEEGYDRDQAVAICYSYYKEELDCTECHEMDLDDACWPGYEAIGMKRKNGRLVPNCVPIENSAFSTNDYPESIKKAAQKGIELNLKHDNKCGTLVGKQRAQQLAKGENISEDTVRRMYSYLSRAGEYYNPSDEDACGTISYLLWGGPDALEWSKRYLEKIEEEKLQTAIIEAAEELGEELDPDTTSYFSTQQFADGETTVGGVLDAIKALDILGKRGADDEAKTVYKYEGPAPQRKFCRAMIRLSRTKVFTRDEINEMTRRGVNSQFNSPVRSGNYDIFKYAGGANCRHTWSEYKMFKSDGRTLLINTGTSGTPPNELPLQGYVNEEQKKKSEIAYAISQNFAVQDEDQQIVVAPAMVPNTLIRRIDENGQEYYVYFAEDTIKRIAEKFFRNNYQNNTNINHNGDITTNNTLLESWIVEDPELDKSQVYGFNVPKGTWFVSMRINDKETWNKIKSGELKGYSIEGSFLELPK